MKKFLSILLICLLCISLFSIRVGAEPAPMFCGDVNWDGSVDGIDTTLIQRHLAGFLTLDEYGIPMADFDHDGEVSSIDVSWMQRAQAHMNVPESVGGLADYWFPVKSFYASYASGKASVDVPVTFTVEMDSTEDYTYAFYIDEELVQPRSTDHTMTYTFDSVRSYYINVRVYNRQGFFREGYLFDYQVVDSFPYDKLSLKQVRWSENIGTTDSPVLVTEAMGGMAPYTYSLCLYRGEETGYGGGTPYTLTDEDIRNYNDYFAANDGVEWLLKQDDQGRYYLYRDFSAAVQTEISFDMLTWWNSYTIYVQAKDEDGGLSDIDHIELMTDLIAG